MNDASGSQRVTGRDAIRPHYHVIDLLRGCAAISILIWHYQHFFFLVPGCSPPAAVLSAQPFATVLEAFYSSGYLAVQLFWLISGFVFANIYVGRPRDAKGFAINRIARLYPLHLLTLLLVAMLQLVSFAMLGRGEIYNNNTIQNFLLHLIMASNWIDSDMHSFNGPVWSVSIEIVVYAVFYLTLPVLRLDSTVRPAGIALSFWILSFVIGTGSNLIAQCAFYFFVGVACQTVARKASAGSLMLALQGIALCLAYWICSHVVPSLYSAIWLPLGLTGAVLLAAAMEKTFVSRVARRFRWIGDNTYGTYLWHVPIQIAALIFLDSAAIDRSIVASPWFLLAFLVVVSLVARVSFLWFEAPARERIRRWATMPPQDETFTVHRTTPQAVRPWCHPADRHP